MRTGNQWDGWWLEVASDLLARPMATFPRTVVSDELAATFGTQVSWNWMNPDGTFGFDLHTPLPGWPPTDIASELSTAITEHPLVAWFASSGDPLPMSIGRVPKGLITRRGRQIVDDYLVPIGMQHQLSIPYQLGTSRYRAFVLARDGEDFSDEDLRLAVRLQTLLLLLDRQCTVLRGCAADSPLTGREHAVLQLLGEGLTAVAIGRRLGISPRTVHRHLQHVYRKLGVSDRLRAVAVARQGGLLCPTAVMPSHGLQVDVNGGWDVHDSTPCSTTVHFVGE